MAAGNSIVGALRVVLGADTAAFETGLKNAQSSLAHFGANAGKSMAAVGAAMVGASVALGLAIKSTINEADKLGKMSQSIGVPVEELSKLKYAAELSDVSFENLGVSLGKLAKNMSAVAGGAVGPAREAFKAMGISVVDTDGKLKSSSAVIEEVAGKFKGYEDGAAKTALAIAIFGKAGAAMIPLLNEGKEGLQKNAEEAERLGIVFDTKTSKAAEAFNDNLTRIGKVWSGVLVKVTAEMSSDFENLSQAFFAASQNAALMQTTASVLTGVMRVLASVAIGTASAFRSTALDFALLSEIAANTAKGEFAKSIDAIKKWRDDTKVVFAEAGAFMDMVWKNPPKLEFSWDSEIAGLSKMSAEVTKLGEAWLKTQAPILNSGAKNALASFIDATRKSIAAQEAEIETTGMATGAKEKLKIKLQALAIEQANHIVRSKEQAAELIAVGLAAELMGLKLGNIALIGETNPFAAIGVAIDATNLKLQEGGLKANDYAILTGQAAQLTQKLWADSATSLGGSFESIGQSMSAMSSDWARFAKVGQAIGATIAFINAYIAATEAFAKTPFPANFAIAAAVLAKGFAMVAAIKGAVIPKAAMGGAFQVPGGIGGGDRMRAMIDLEPGELVEVSSNRAGGYQSSGGRGGGIVNLTLNGRSFHREEVTELLGTVQDLIRDGYQLKLAPA